MASRRLPSVDEILRSAASLLAIAHYGRPAVVGAIRREIAAARAAGETRTAEDFAAAAATWLAGEAEPDLRPVFNLTGTVLHTNLGRALLAEAAVEAATRAMRNAVALEFDLDSGGRGERDDIVRSLLCELAGAEDATIVNNNAGAVLLVLNTLALGKEAIVSRGELIEIGGAFRMPDIMKRAGVRLVEVGTTNRTHMKDYIDGLGPDSGLILKVHTSNYRIEGFTAEVTARELAMTAKANGVPLVNDLGSGTLVDLRPFGLSHEPTVAEAIAEGSDLVTFSGDKLLGGPQAGFIIGRKDLIARLNKNPMKRALRIDKIRLAALEATLRLYRDPDRLAQSVPTYRLLARSAEDIEALAGRLRSAVQSQLGDDMIVTVTQCASQIGSGALPVEVLRSAGLAIVAGSGSGRALSALAAALRALPIPVIGRIENGALILDFRCLEDEAGFVANLKALNWPETRDGMA